MPKRDPDTGRFVSAETNKPETDKQTRQHDGWRRINGRRVRVYKKRA